MNIDIYTLIHYATNICTALPFAMQIFTYIICSSYKKSATDMHNTNKEIFRSMKLRYSNCAKLGIALEDTRSFVYKYLYGTEGPFRLPLAIDKLSCFIYCLALLSTTALFTRGHIDMHRMISVLAASFCFYIFRSGFSASKQMMFTVELAIDYLDNTLKHRLVPNRSNIEAPFKSYAQANVDTADLPSSDMPEKSIDNIKEPKQSAPTPNVASIKFNLNPQESDIIESVLQEFLA